MLVAEVVAEPLSIEYRQRPFGNVVGVLLEESAVGHAEQQTSVNIVNRVIVDIHAVGKGDTSLAVENGFVIARNHLRNGDIVTALHNSLGNT